MFDWYFLEKSNRYIASKQILELTKCSRVSPATLPESMVTDTIMLYDFENMRVYADAEFVFSEHQMVKYKETCFRQIEHAASIDCNTTHLNRRLSRDVFGLM